MSFNSFVYYAIVLIFLFNFFSVISTSPVALGGDAKYCEQRVCVRIYLFVCLSVRSHISKATRANFLHVLPVAVARFSSGWLQCNMLCTSGFVDDVMFSHINGANRPETKTTRMFRTVR